MKKVIVFAFLSHVFAVATRKELVKAGMLKGFWLPGVIRKPGTYK